MSQQERALAALTRAEHAALAIRRDLRRKALLDQLVLGAREIEHPSPIGFAAHLGLPAWCWMLIAALLVVLQAPVAGILPIAGAAALAALLLRTWLVVHAASQLFRPAPADERALRDALAECTRALRAPAPGDPYRHCDRGWAGDDPEDAERPWTELATIRRTAAALRALPPAPPRE